MNKFLIILCLLISAISYAQIDRYWIATSSGTWSNPDNWSTTMNGDPIGGSPNEGDRVVFTGSDKGSCVLDVNINVEKFETNADYVSEINFRDKSVTVGEGDLRHTGGTIDAKTSSVTILGDLIVSSSFISTTKLMVLKGSMKLGDQEDFNPTTGTVRIECKESTVIQKNPQFFSLELAGIDQTSNAIVAHQGFRVYHDVSIAEVSEAIKLDGGVVKIGGDLHLNSAWKEGNALIELDGLGNQFIYGYQAKSVKFSKLSIKKLSGNVHCHSSILISAELILSQGNILIGEGNEVKMDDLAVIVGGSELSYVHGQLTKIGATDFVFHVGSADKYAPVSVTNLSETADISCRYFNASLPDQALMDPTIAAYDDCSYWNINTSNTANMNLIFHLDQYNGCLKLRNPQRYEVIAQGAQGWGIVQKVIQGNDVVLAEQMPSGNYTLGSLGADQCQEGPMYWVGGYSTSWQDAQNWSSVSGGPGGYGVPCFENTPIFDGNGDINCVLNADVTIQQMLILPDYTSEINSNGNALVVTELFK